MMAVNTENVSTKVDNSLQTSDLQQRSYGNNHFAFSSPSAATDVNLRRVGGKVESKALTEFHYFPKLPVEVRRMIWHFTLPGPRNVDMGCHTPCTIDPDGDFEEIRDRGIDSPIFPMALQINHESRAVALKRYTIIHRHREYSRDTTLFFKHNQGDLKPICIDPTIDHAYFQWDDVYFREKWEFEWMTSMETFHPKIFEAITEVEVRGVNFERLEWLCTDMIPIYVANNLCHDRKYSAFGAAFCLPNIRKLRIYFNPRTCLTKCPGLPSRAKFTTNVHKLLDLFEYPGGGGMDIEMPRWLTTKQWIANLWREHLATLASP